MKTHSMKRGPSQNERQSTESLEEADALLHLVGEVAALVIEAALGHLVDSDANAVVEIVVDWAT